MNNDDIDTVLLARKNYKILLGSTIITSILLFGGLLLLVISQGITEEGSIYMAYMVYIFFMLSTSINLILGSAGLLPWSPLGKKRAPIPYFKLLSILERQLYKDIDSIEYLGTVSKKS